MSPACRARSLLRKATAQPAQAPSPTWLRLASLHMEGSGPPSRPSTAARSSQTSTTPRRDSETSPTGARRGDLERITAAAVFKARQPAEEPTDASRLVSGPATSMRSLGYVRSGAAARMRVGRSQGMSVDRRCHGHHNHYPSEFPRGAGTFPGRLLTPRTRENYRFILTRWLDWCTRNSVPGCHTRP
jgi:hypothetical protein